MRGVMRSAIAGALLVGLGACEPASKYYGATKPRHGPDEIWTNLGTEPETIDPNKASDSAAGEVMETIFTGLVEPHPKTLEPLPGIAERWDIDDEGRRYTFHLRQSAWSDGTPLTAHDFEYAWKRLLDPKTASKYGTFLHPIELGEAFNTRALMVRNLPPDATEAELRSLLGPQQQRISRIQLVSMRGLAALFVPQGDDAAQLRADLIVRVSGAKLHGATLTIDEANAADVGVRALDDHTLQVRIENPLPYFLDLLGYYVTYPVPRHLIARLTEQGINPDLWTRPEHIVCNGPYVIDEWKFRQHIWFERNPRYWDVASVRTKRIRFVMVESYNTTLNLYKTGELDYIGGNSRLPAEFMDHLSTFADFHSDPYLTVYLYWLNTSTKPLDDVRVRRALSLSIDRASLVKYVTRGGEIPSANLVPDGLRGYRGPHSVLFDPARAKQLLVEAGYGPDKPLPTITLSYNTSEGHKQIAEAVQQMWKEHLGIEVQIENQEWKVYLKNLEHMHFQAARLSWVGDYADPFTFLELLKSNNGNNHSLWKNARYDDLLHQANATLDGSRRFALLRQAETLALEQAPLIPVYVYTRNEMWKPYLKGQWPNYLNRHPAKYWWIDRRWYDGVPSAVLQDPPPSIGEVTR